MNTLNKKNGVATRNHWRKQEIMHEIIHGNDWLAHEPLLLCSGSGTNKSLSWMISCIFLRTVKSPSWLLRNDSFQYVLKNMVYWCVESESHVSTKGHETIIIICWTEVPRLRRSFLITMTSTFPQTKPL